MSNLTKDLFEIISAKYPTVSKEIVKDIIETTTNRMNKDDYEIAFVVQHKLGLRAGYFADALRRNVEIKADIEKVGNYIYVKLDFEIRKLLADNYICCKITQDEVDSFDYVIHFTKNTLLGFYK